MTKETPILFSTAMVQAILAGRKTQTRRVISATQSGSCSVFKKLLDWTDIMPNGSFGIKLRELKDRQIIWRVAPKYSPGDLMWVRETIFCHPVYNRKDELRGWCGSLFAPDGSAVAFRGYTADPDYYNPDRTWKVIPSIHMPKNIARIWLRCTNVRAERLLDITEKDAIAEGIEPLNDPILPAYYNYMYGEPGHYKRDNFLTDGEYSFNDGKESQSGAVASFCTLWMSINGEASWKANPWVWVYEFEVVSTNGKPINI